MTNVTLVSSAAPVDPSAKGRGVIPNKIPCTIYDAAEGRIHITVNASNEAKAFDEAGICAAELGCRYVDEIVVGIHE